MNRNLAIALAAIAVAQIDPPTVAGDGGSYDDLARSCASADPAFGQMDAFDALAALRAAVEHIEDLDAIECPHVREFAGCLYPTRCALVEGVVEGFVGAGGANDIRDILSGSTDFDLLREMIEEAWIEKPPLGINAYEALGALRSLRARYAVEIPDFADDEFEGSMVVDLYLRGSAAEGDLHIDYLRHTGGSWLADDDAICLGGVRSSLDGVELTAWLRSPAQQIALWRIAEGTEDEASHHDNGFLADTGCRVRLSIEEYMEAMSGHYDGVDQLASDVIDADQLTEDEWGDFELYEDEDHKAAFEMSRVEAVRFLEIRWHQADELSESVVKLGLALIIAGELSDGDFTAQLRLNA